MCLAYNLAKEKTTKSVAKHLWHTWTRLTEGSQGIMLHALERATQVICWSQNIGVVVGLDSSLNENWKPEKRLSEISTILILYKEETLKWHNFGEFCLELSEHNCKALNAKKKLWK